MVPTAWIYSTQFEFCSPQLHQHLRPHLTCHLNNKTYPLTPDLHWHNIYTCASCAGIWIHATTTNIFNSSSSFCTCYLVPLHFLCTHFWQLVHCIELLLTPLPLTPHGHLTAFCITFCCLPTNHNPGFITRDSIYAIARICYGNSVCLSVRPSVTRVD